MLGRENLHPGHPFLCQKHQHRLTLNGAEKTMAWIVDCPISPTKCSLSKKKTHSIVCHWRLVNSVLGLVIYSYMLDPHIFMIEYHYRWFSDPMVGKSSCWILSQIMFYPIMSSLSPIMYPLYPSRLLQLLSDFILPKLLVTLPFVTIYHIYFGICQWFTVILPWFTNIFSCFCTGFNRALIYLSWYYHDL